MSAWSQRGQRWCEWDGDGSGAGGARHRSGARAHRLRALDRSVRRRSGPDHGGRAHRRCVDTDTLGQPHQPADQEATLDQAEQAGPAARAGRQGPEGPRAAAPAAPARLVLRRRSPAATASARSKGVKGFQEKRKLTKTGDVDRATWAALVKRTRKPTNAEMHNRLVAGPAILRQGSSGDRVRDLQARLKQIGWFSGSGDRHVRHGDRRQRQGIPGQAADPGHRRGRSAHPGPAARDDPDADQRRVAQPDPEAVGEPGSTRAA